MLVFVNKLRCPACKGNVYAEDGGVTCLMCARSFSMGLLRSLGLLPTRVSHATSPA